MPTVPSLTLPTPAAKPLFAYVGAGDAALATLRSRAATRAGQLKSVPDQLKAATTQFQEQVKGLPLIAAALPAQVKELQATVEKRYNELAARGEQVVGQLRGGTTVTAKPATAKKPAARKAPAKPATKPAAATVDPAATAATPTVPTPASANGAVTPTVAS